MTFDAAWYKDAVFYQLRIRSFYDGNGDGIGDLVGLTEKLPYLQDLGVTTLWLLPFYPSPLRDDGYDISDYMDVHPECGTLREFRAFLREAHRRDLRVVTELVLNHTSDQHPWFQRARRAPPGSRHREFYVWSDTPTRYSDARIIFKDFEPSNWAWDPVAQAYYWHRFYSHQPDLNFENPDVRRALLQFVDFWLDLGVDGLRLDAVPYLFEREGTDCENLPETHAFLRELRAHVDAKFPGRMLLAEANQWPEDAAAYFGEGDECHMAFHFPIMPRLFMAIHMEDRFPILDILEQTPKIPDSSQWALFLRNHDELTLEMVTDEDRDYMWRVYARDPKARINLGIRRRLAPLLDNDRRKMELMTSLLLSLPGTPVLYYGDEIGMGDNVYLGDRNGVRTPMQWSPDRNAGFSKANPQQLILPVIMDPAYHYETVNVENEHGNASSLLWWTKRVVALRRQFRAFGRGTFEPLAASNRKVLAFVRRYEGEVLVGVSNLSRFSQYVDLDLSEYRGRIPMELFGHVEFPRIGEDPYRLTLGPHSFYWFALESPRTVGAGGGAEPESLPLLEVDAPWETLLGGRVRDRLERCLPEFLAGRRWFRGKAQHVRKVSIRDAVPIPGDEVDVQLALLDVEYVEGSPETYVLPLAFRPGEAGRENGVARLRVRTRDGLSEGVLVEATDQPALPASLLETVARRRKLRGQGVEIRGVRARGYARLREGEGPLPRPRLLGVEQSNTSWVFGERAVMKLYRQLEEGTGLDLEMIRYLTERTPFRGVPPLLGHLELDAADRETATLAMAQLYVPNEGDAWSFTLDELQRYFERALPRLGDLAAFPTPPAGLLDRARMEPPEEAAGLVGAYLDQARLIGRRTGELHLALAADTPDPLFAPEPFTPMARRSLYQSVRARTARTLELLEGRVGVVPEEQGEAARELVRRESAIVDRVRRILDRRLGGRRIRCHGDYHLGQLLYTGRDFVIIDFEGEPARSLGERRLKRSPLVDVAGMLRSFHYAAETALAGPSGETALRAEDARLLRPWAQHWYAWVGGAFFAGYLAQVEGSAILPESPDDLLLLLEVYVLDKVLYELGYELNNRPEWIGIPLRGMEEVLRAWPDER